MAYTINITQLADAELAARIAEGQAAQTAAEAAQSGAEAARDTTLSYRDTTLGYRNTAETHKDSAAVSAALAAAEAAGIVGYDLSAIADTIAATAVDVFVYDTTQDSDGGAWRNRCQHTSWYNETLNTATRGARQEFPVKALIVAEAASVTIYDLDDPAVPMWMVFAPTAVTTPHFWRDGRLATCVTFRNGLLCFGISQGTNNNQAGIALVDLLKDQLSLTNNSETYGYNTVAERTSQPVLSIVSSIREIIDTSVNDIAITVLPGAPIDDQTGLPVPTIAVATAGGVSVIKDDGTVVDITGYNQAPEFIDLYEDGTILTCGRFGSWLQATALPSADRTINVTSADREYQTTTGTGVSLPLAASATGDRVFNGVISGENSISVYQEPSVNTNGTLVTFAENPVTKENGMVAYTTADYATGWMQGDVKGAFLCEASDDDLVGGELITNGTFDTDTTGWTLRESDGTFTSSGGQGVITYVSSATSYEQTVSVVAGKTYVISLDYVGGTSATVQVFYNDASDVLIGTPTSAETLTATVTPTTTTLNIFLRVAASGTAIFDNVSVKLANEDRSVNANGLAVNGTITVAPVETGAETMAYSGFSTTKYLSQPYNSALDFGTGDFYVMGWVNFSDVSPVSTIMRKGDVANTAAFNLYNQSGLLYFVTREASVNSTVTSSTAFTNGNWAFFAVVRSASGTSLDIHINGVLSNSASVTARNTNSTEPLFVGTGSNDTSAFLRGSLSRLRIGAGAPTPEQIRKIYRDELPLYRENAACTINGTSSEITAMASDPVTGLLQVGTSGGMSGFRGLQRVEQDTTAVTNTISANGATVARQ